MERASAAEVNKWLRNHRRKNTRICSSPKTLTLGFADVEKMCHIYFKIHECRSDMKIMKIYNKISKRQGSSGEMYLRWLSIVRDEPGRESP